MPVACDMIMKTKRQCYREIPASTPEQRAHNRDKAIEADGKDLMLQSRA